MRRSLLLAIIAVAVAATAATALYISKAGNAVYLQLQGLPRRSLVAVFVEAVTPDGPRPVHAGMYYLPNGNEAIPIPMEPLHRIALEWVKTRPGLAEYGLIIHAIALTPKMNSKDKTYEKYAHILDVASLSIDRIINRKTILITARVEKIGSVSAAHIRDKRMQTLSPIELVRLAKAEVIGRGSITSNEPPEPPLGPNNEPLPTTKVCVETLERRAYIFLVPVEICWDPKVYLRPEDIAYNAPGLNKIVTNGRVYIETPMVILNNTVPNRSATVAAYIGYKERAQRYAIYASLSINPGKFVDLIKKLKKSKLSEILPSMTIWRSDGPVWASNDKAYEFSRILIATPGHTMEAYVFARPYYVVYQVNETIYLGFYTIEAYGVEEYALISDIATNEASHTILSGTREFKPNNALAKELLNVAKLTYVKSIYPHSIDPNLERVTLDEMVKATMTKFNAKCGAEVGITLPAGTLLALGACTAFAKAGIVLPPTACKVLKGIFGGFVVSFTHEPAERTIKLEVHNLGDVEDVPTDINTLESIYVGTSLARYKVEDCEGTVPFGIYIESR